VVFPQPRRTRHPTPHAITPEDSNNPPFGQQTADGTALTLVLRNTGGGTAIALTVTQDVIEALYETLLESGLAGIDALRLAGDDDGYTLEVDEPSRDDRVIWFRDNPVLVIAPAVEDSLGDAIIDLDSDDGDRLMLVIRTDG
jgi:hypothetical protein